MDGIINDIMTFIKDRIIVISIIASLLVLFIYVICSVTINKLNKAHYGKNTWMAWIPPFNFYLLGKLTIHTVFGIILALGSFLTVGVTITNNGVQEYYSILPENIIVPYSIVYSSIVVILLIVAFFKSKRMIMNGEVKNDELNYSQNINNNLNRPFIEKKNVNNSANTTNVGNNKSNSNQNFNYNNTSEITKISLSSINTHNDDNNSNNIQNP